MFLVIALDETDGEDAVFDISDIKTKGKDAGSETIIVRVGTLSGGDTGTEDVTLTSDNPEFPLPKEQGSYLDLATLVGNQATYFGSYEVYPYDGASTTEPHMLTTASAEIDPDIQIAVFAAASDLDATVDSNPFMKTGQIAGVVYDHLPSGSSVTLDEIAAALFGPDTSADPTPEMTTTDTGEEVLSVDCTGELFPHEDPASKLFDFSFKVKKASSKSAKFSLENLVRQITIAVKESSINPDKQGNMPLAVISTPGFDATGVDTSTVLLYLDDATTGGVAPESSSESDQNGDNITDLLLHFSVPKLKSAGLSTSTKTVTLRGETDDNLKFEGTAPINVK